MVIRTEYRGTRYCMGSSDPLPVGFEIRFGGLNFQATGNDYLMRLTNREELHGYASAGDESSLGSIDAPPPADRHGYAEWDFSGVPDPVMFRRFLDATDYWFGCSDDSCTGSYDPVRECCVVIANDPANATGAVGAGDGEVTPAPGIAPRLAAGPSTPAWADADAQLAQARELEAKLAEEYRTVGAEYGPDTNQ